MTCVQGTEYVTLISGLTGGEIVATDKDYTRDILEVTYEIVFPDIRSAVCALESFTDTPTELDIMLKRPIFTGHLKGHSFMELDDETKIVITSIPA